MSVAVLACAGLGDDARLAHAHREQDLPEAVVDLVRPGVIELVALEVDLRPAVMRGKPLREIERRGPAHIIAPEGVHQSVEGRVVLGGPVGPLQVQHQRHQRLGDEPAAIGAETAFGVGQVLPVAARVHGEGFKLPQPPRIGR
jgi:hypothetical protein